MRAANNTCNLFSFICVAKARVMIDTKICYNKNVLSLQFCPGTASQPKDCATDIIRPHWAQLMIDNLSIILWPSADCLRIKNVLLSSRNLSSPTNRRIAWQAKRTPAHQVLDWGRNIYRPGKRCERRMSTCLQMNDLARAQLQPSLTSQVSPRLKNCRRKGFREDFVVEKIPLLAGVCMP